MRLGGRLSREEVKLLYKLRDAISRLDSDELRAFMYVWDNISVGEIVYERDLARVYGVKKPIAVAVRLREKGMLERGEGCYNLPRWIRGLRLKIGRFEELRSLLDRLP